MTPGGHQGIPGWIFLEEIMHQGCLEKATVNVDWSGSGVG